MSNSPSEIGYRLFPAIEDFQETFEKSAAQSLARFFVEAPARKWMVFSDYAFYDPQKQSDVFVLSLVPYVVEFDALSAHIQGLSFKDIKHLRRVNPEFIEYLRRAPIANIAVLLPRDRRLVNGDEKGAIIDFFSGLEAMIEKWHESTPQGNTYHTLFLKDLKHLRWLVQFSQANLRLLRDSILVASITGYVLFRAVQMADAELIGWFSDRDALLSYQSKKLHLPLIYQLLNTYYHALCEKAGQPGDNLVLGLPEEVGPVFYDSFLRVPDLVAATMADLNFSDLSFTHPKFGPIMDDLLLSNEKCIFFALRKNPIDGTPEAVRHTLERG